MKNLLFSMAIVFMLVPMLSSCSDDDKNEDLKFNEQTYSTWSKVVFGYGSMFDAGETLQVSQSRILFHSGTWGDGTAIYFNAADFDEVLEAHANQGEGETESVQ